VSIASRTKTAGRGRPTAAFGADSVWAGSRIRAEPVYRSSYSTMASTWPFVPPIVAGTVRPTEFERAVPACRPLWDERRGRNGRMAERVAGWEDSRNGGLTTKHKGRLKGNVARLLENRKRSGPTPSGGMCSGWADPFHRAHVRP
jgi:hypothetical protein